MAGSGRFGPRAGPREQEWIKWTVGPRSASRRSSRSAPRLADGFPRPPLSAPKKSPQAVDHGPARPRLPPFLAPYSTDRRPSGGDAEPVEVGGYGGSPPAPVVELYGQVIAGRQQGFTKVDASCWSKLRALPYCRVEPHQAPVGRVADRASVIHRFFPRSRHNLGPLRTTQRTTAGGSSAFHGRLSAPVGSQRAACWVCGGGHARRN